MAESGPHVVTSAFWKLPLTELAGKQMGIVGHGRIGRRVGELASAFRHESDSLIHGGKPIAPDYDALFLGPIAGVSREIGCDQSSLSVDGRDDVDLINRELLSRCPSDRPCLD